MLSNLNRNWNIFLMTFLYIWIILNGWLLVFLSDYSDVWIFCEYITDLLRPFDLYVRALCKYINVFFHTFIGGVLKGPDVSQINCCRNLYVRAWQHVCCMFFQHMSCCYAVIMHVHTYSVHNNVRWEFMHWPIYSYYSLHMFSYRIYFYSLLLIIIMWLY